VNIYIVTLMALSIFPRPAIHVQFSCFVGASQICCIVQPPDRAGTEVSKEGFFQVQLIYCMHEHVQPVK